MDITIPAGKGRRRAATGALAAGLALAGSVATAQPLAIEGLVITGTGRMRVAIIVPEAIPYRATIVPGTNVLNIDLPGNVGILPEVCAGILADPVIRGCDVGRVLVGHARIRIVLPACGAIDGSRLMEPLADQAGQILVDVVYGRPVRCVFVVS